MPEPIIKVVRRVRKRAECPVCGRPCSAYKRKQRRLRDIGDLRGGRPVELHVIYAQYYCRRCGRYFNVDMSNLAKPGAQYTRPVVELAVRLVGEESLAYRQASWHLWRDHRVFVPIGTVQNWVQAAEKEGDGGA